jgi:hypothetical protein
MSARYRAAVRAITVQDYRLLIRLPGDERADVTLAARDIYEAKQTAARLHGVTADDVQILAITARA